MVATLMLALEVLFLKLKPLILTGIAGGLITLKLQYKCPGTFVSRQKFWRRTWDSKKSESYKR